MRALRLNQIVKQYDRYLHVKTNPVNGCFEVWRNEPPKDLFGLSQARRVYDQLILPLTDSWTITGRPVDWGIEPLLERIKEMDSWRDDTYYCDIVAKREEKKRLSDSRFKREIRDSAKDLRRDFAKATNEYIPQT